MIVIVLGMHKSGTTLIAKTLHESGIHMGVEEVGNYPKCKYEDPRVSQITKKILYGSESQNRKSLDLPSSSYFQDNIKIDIIAKIKDYILDRCKKHGTNWGFKFPDVTLCYDIWKDYLPFHKAVGVIRKREKIIEHYQKRRKNKSDIKTINRVCDNYEALLYSYNIPYVHYENIMRFGNSELEKIIGIKLKDCRRKK